MTALKYTKPLKFRNTPALKDSERNIAVFIKDKEVLIRKSAFPKPLSNFFEPPTIPLELAHIKITKETAAQVLVTQVVIKASSPDKINFQIL